MFAAVIVTLIWSAIGDVVLRILPDEFAPVHRSAVIALMAVVALAGAVAINNVLYLGRAPGRGSLNAVVFALVTLGGTMAAVQRGGESLVDNIAWTYVAAATSYFVVAYAVLFRHRGMRIPIGKASLLALPATLALPVVGWEAAVWVRILVVFVILGVYVSLAIGFRLIPAKEIRAILNRSNLGSRS